MATRAAGGTTAFHVVQDVPTPHNNALLGALAARTDVTLEIWYARPTNSEYGFSSDLANAIQPAAFYGTLFGSSRLLARALTHRHERWLIVAWSNPTTRLLVFLCWLTQRPFNMWFDLPDDGASGHIGRREFARWFLRRSKSNVFCVGPQTVDFFAERGFSRDRLVNLPVVLGKNGQNSEEALSRTEIRSKLKISDSTFLVVTGSRLTRDKGFDLLIEAVRLIPMEVRAGLKVVIVGQGEEGESLAEDITRSGLIGTVDIRPWLPEQEFRDLFIAADVVVHPARMDAYGGISLMALAEGRPLIGTRQAGSASDIIRDGFNGWLYDFNDTGELSQLIQRSMQNPEAMQILALNMNWVRDNEGRNPDQTAARLLANLV